MAECSSAENASEEVFDFVCGPCNIDGEVLQAKGYCSDCLDYLCDLCFKTHIRPKPMRHHVLLDEKAMPKDKITPSSKASDICTERCEKHSGNIIEYYCQSHDFLGCTKCFISDNHRKCDGVVCIQDTARGIFDSHEFTKFEGKVQQLSDVLSESSLLQHQNDENIIRAKKEIRNFRANMTEYIDGLENAMDNQVSQMKDRQASKFSSKQIKELETNIKTIKDTIESTRNLGKKSNLYIYMKRNYKKIKRLEDRIETVKNDSGVSEYTFTSNAYLQKIEEMTKTFGKLAIMEDKHMEETLMSQTDRPYQEFSQFLPTTSTTTAKPHPPTVQKLTQRQTSNSDRKDSRRTKQASRTLKEAMQRTEEQIALKNFVHKDTTKDVELLNKIKQIIMLTSCSQTQAETALYDHPNDLEKAVDGHYVGEWRESGKKKKKPQKPEPCDNRPLRSSRGRGRPDRAGDQLDFKYVENVRDCEDSYRWYDRGERVRVRGRGFGSTTGGRRGGGIGDGDRGGTFRTRQPRFDKPRNQFGQFQKFDNGPQKETLTNATAVIGKHEHNISEWGDNTKDWNTEDWHTEDWNTEDWN